MLDHFSLLESVVVLRVLVPILVSLCGLRVRLAGLEMARNAANKRSIFSDSYLISVFQLVESSEFFTTLSTLVN